VPSARAVATSSAALDETPSDCGTSDDTSSRTRGGSITPWRISTSATPTGYRVHRGASPSAARILGYGSRASAASSPGGSDTGPTTSASAGSAVTVVVSAVGVSSTSAPE
jgi:hypothetical protein